MAAGRGALLLLVAVVLGIVLLNKTDDTPQTTVEQRATTTTARKSTTQNSVFSSTTTVPPLQPHNAAAVKVLSVNGTTMVGIAGRAKEVLLAAGFNTLSPTDAKTKPQKTTSIFYAVGYQADANVMATLLKAPATAVKPMPANPASLVKDDRSVAQAHVIVVVGEDIASSLPASKSTSTTSTTARRSSSSTTSTTAKSTTTTKKP